MNEIIDNKMIDQIKSGAFTLGFKRKLPQDAGKMGDGDNLEVR